MTDTAPTHESVQDISQRQRKLRDDAIENQLSSLTKCASMVKLRVMDIIQEYASIRALPVQILSEFGTHASSVIELCQDLIYKRYEGGGTDDLAPWETCQEEVAGVERQLRRTLVSLEELVQVWEDTDDEFAEDTTTEEESIPSQDVTR